MEFEQSVLYEILPNLIDSLNMDLSIPPPPTPKHILDTNGDSIGIDTLEMEKTLKEYKEIKEGLIASSSESTIAISDSVELLKETDKEKLQNFFKEINIEPFQADMSIKYKVELDKIKPNNKLKLKYRSEYPKSTDLWNDDDNLELDKLFNFSRIQFDNTKTYGLLNSSYTCGLMCGRGANVFIKKENGTWKIIAFLRTWVA